MDTVMPRDKNSGEYRGFALVRIGSESELARAIEMLHGESFGGHRLLVQRARFGPSFRNSSHTSKLLPKPNPVTTHRPKTTPTLSELQAATSFKDALLQPLHQPPPKSHHQPPKLSTQSDPPPPADPPPKPSTQPNFKEGQPIQIDRSAFDSARTALKDSVVIISKEGATLSQIKDWIAETTGFHPGNYTIKPLGYKELWVNLCPGINPDMLLMAGHLHNGGPIAKVVNWEEYSIFGTEKVWFQVWGIPPELWYDEFFISVAAFLGPFLNIDIKTKLGEELGVIRVQVRRKKGSPVPSHVCVHVDNRQLEFPVVCETHEDLHPRWGDIWRYREGLPPSPMEVPTSAADRAQATDALHQLPCSRGPSDDFPDDRLDQTTRTFISVHQLPSSKQVQHRKKCDQSDDRDPSTRGITAADCSLLSSHPSPLPEANTLSAARMTVFDTVATPIMTDGSRVGEQQSDQAGKDLCVSSPHPISSTVGSQLQTAGSPLLDLTRHMSPRVGNPAPFLSLSSRSRAASIKLSLNPLRSHVPPHDSSHVDPLALSAGTPSPGSGMTQNSLPSCYSDEDISGHDTSLCSYFQSRPSSPPTAFYSPDDVLDMGPITLFQETNSEVICAEPLQICADLQHHQQEACIATSSSVDRIDLLDKMHNKRWIRDALGCVGRSLGLSFGNRLEDYVALFQCIENKGRPLSEGRSQARSSNKGGNNRELRSLEPSPGLKLDSSAKIRRQGTRGSSVAP